VRRLLDTHAALWSLSEDDCMGEEAARRLTDDRNQVLLSAMVVWEVAIKRSLGTLDMPGDFAPTLLGAGAQPLSVTPDHAAVESLPWHPRDPFDWLLIAQALGEGAAPISHDERFSRYGVQLIW
jgi:PIN domain nuclease of toxin-antitoxin system